MVKTVRLEPISQEAEVATNSTLLSVLLEKELNVLRECGGRGMCATCHVYIKKGVDCLSPVGRRESRTLEVITSAKMNSRLACQSRVLGNGVVVEVPSGMYISAIDDIEELVGRRAEQDLLHPLTGAVSVEAGKLITRSVLRQLQTINASVGDFFSKSQKV